MSVRHRLTGIQEICFTIERLSRTTALQYKSSHYLQLQAQLLTSPHPSKYSASLNDTSGSQSFLILTSKNCTFR
ncbi:hypothetical protein BDZ91DRAFT_724872 [Kalaharituber pfeilii]|nr:hypothetical protein BDZ91DRAFT_724872 [Kalaharituber pfeilii]